MGDGDILNALNEVEKYTPYFIVLLLIQTLPEKELNNESAKLYCFNIDANSLEPVEDPKYIFYCPKISPDGRNMTVFGMNRNDPMNTTGYYVYDLQTKETKILKELNVKGNQGFLLGLFFGYGNMTSWN